MLADLQGNRPYAMEGQHEGFQLRLLGSFLLRQGDTQITVPTGPQRLLAFLAIHGPAPRPVILGTLWPNAREPRARGSLRTAMWRLHRDAPRLIRPVDDALILGPDVVVDLHSVTDSAQSILQNSSEIPDDRWQLFAVGELLHDWRDDWVIFERERLRQLRLHALDVLAERFAAQGRYTDALEAALESARIGPLRETANRMIIAIHLAGDNVAEALGHYEFIRDLLGAELGIEPSRQLTAMLSPWLRTLVAADLSAPVGSERRLLVR
jgi:DNA-binding SARP family transcriptional activator